MPFSRSVPHRGINSLTCETRHGGPHGHHEEAPVCPHHPTCRCRQSLSGADEASWGCDSWAWAAPQGAMKQRDVQRRGTECCLRLLQVGKACMDAAWRDVLSQLETTPADGTAPRGSVEGERKERGTKAWSTSPADNRPVCPCLLPYPRLLDLQHQHCPQDALAETEVHRPHSSGVSSSRDGTVDLCAAEVQEHTARPSWAPLRPWGPGPTSSASASGSPHTSQSRAVDCGYPGAASSSPSSTFQYSWPRKK